MTEADVHAWVGNKERHWDELGFGPWGIRIEGTLAGWGGLQPFNGDSEVALVLTPEFWGWGKAIFLELTQYAFGELGLTHVVVALPPTRGRARGFFDSDFVASRQQTSRVIGSSSIGWTLRKPPPGRS